tara:strand:+ start:851 stop:2131 length:1281 start_codon:yes stop_codon:yes gene_type:complete
MYKQKYLKYKQKYLDLKGGTINGHIITLKINNLRLGIIHLLPKISNIDTFERIKVDIRQLSGIPIKDQRLIYAGKDLNNSNNIQSIIDKGFQYDDDNIILLSPNYKLLLEKNYGEINKFMENEFNKFNEVAISELKRDTIDILIIGKHNRESEFGNDININIFIDSLRTNLNLTHQHLNIFLYDNINTETFTISRDKYNINFIKEYITTETTFSITFDIILIDYSTAHLISNFLKIIQNKLYSSLNENGKIYLRGSIYTSTFESTINYYIEKIKNINKILIIQGDTAIFNFVRCRDHKYNCKNIIDINLIDDNPIYLMFSDDKHLMFAILKKLHMIQSIGFTVGTEIDWISPGHDDIPSIDIQKSKLKDYKIKNNTTLIWKFTTDTKIYDEENFTKYTTQTLNDYYPLYHKDHGKTTEDMIILQKK